MKVERIFNIEKSIIYDFLIESLLEDIKNNTDKEVTRSDLRSGFTYHKTLADTLGKPVTVNSIVDELLENESYKMRIQTHNGDYIITYKLEDLGDSKTRVQVEEAMVSPSTFTDWNQKLMQFIFKKSLNKKANQKLEQLEKNIIRSKGVNNDL